MRIILLMMLLVSWQSLAQQKTIKVAVNIGPPWAYFESGKGVTGIDVEIIRHIFRKHGYKTEFYLLAYNRLIQEFNNGKFDMASPAAFDGKKGYLTTPYLPFQDVAISLKNAHLKINQLTDLKGKSIIAYQHAKSVLGEKYAAVLAHTNYLEMAQREIQVKLLVHKRTDVVIGERRVLSYIAQKKFPEARLQVHPIFATKTYGAIAKDKKMQQLFNQELEKMKASGEYQKILAKWP